LTRTPTPLEQRLLRYLRAQTLTRRQFEMMVLHYEHNLSLGQIALALDVSRGTVAGTLRRSRQKIEIHEREAV
jgi:DNA-binding CsgD family transcriptional regulator